MSDRKHFGENCTVPFLKRKGHSKPKHRKCDTDVWSDALGAVVPHPMARKHLPTMAFFFVIWGEYLKRGEGKREGRGRKERKKRKEKEGEKEGEIKQYQIRIPYINCIMYLYKVLLSYRSS